MKTRLAAVAAAILFSTAIAAPASAVTYTYVGSWTVDQGPRWTAVPTAYSGQTAAALLFGGTAAKYAISTVDASVANIDNLSWVTTYGGACNGTFPCGTKVAEAFVQSTNGLYANMGDTSAYASDWATGSEYTNYAFAMSGGVPEPATWALMILGFGAVGGAMRRRQSIAAKVRFA